MFLSKVPPTDPIKNNGPTFEAIFNKQHYKRWNKSIRLRGRFGLAFLLVFEAFVIILTLGQRSFVGTVLYGMSYGEKRKTSN